VGILLQKTKRRKRKDRRRNKNDEIKNTKKRNFGYVKKRSDH